MKLGVGLAAPAIVVHMLAGIPAAGRHIDAAAEGEGVIDYHNFLVVRPASWMRCRTSGEFDHRQPSGRP
jgi:hypothetical protein